MLGLGLIILGLIPIMLGVIAGKYWADTVRDGWIMIGIGVIGAICIFVHAYRMHCMDEVEAQENDRDDE
jgi:hypothetical protein